MNFTSRLQKAVRVLLEKHPSPASVAARLDTMVTNKEFDLGTATIDKESRLDVRNSTRDYAYASLYGMYFSSITNWVKLNEKKLPRGLNYDDPSIDVFISEIWKHEPIFAGAVYSMSAKMASLRWTVTGTRLHAMNVARILSRAAYYGGYDWGGFISSTAQDFYTTNNGVYWELAKEGDPIFGKLVDVGYIDSLCCNLTGNQEYPMRYLSAQTGQMIPFKYGEFTHFASLPSGREMNLGRGFCAAARAYRAARLLMGLHQYDDEKLDNLPPEGIAAVTGLTLDELEDALEHWAAKRKSDESLTYPQLLWLVGSQPNAQVGVNLTGFSQLPESFDRKSVVEQYINTLALCFGVDAREFWSINAGNLGSGAESEIQHLKAKGKGPGEFISVAERAINAEIPSDCGFVFDTQDIEEDANSAAVAKAWIDAFMPLYNLPPEPGSESIKENNRPEKPDGSPVLPTTNIPGVDTGGRMSINEGGQGKFAYQVITRDEFKRLLADKGILPDWMLNDKRVVVTDTDVHTAFYKEGNPDETTEFVYERGTIKEIRPVINLGYTQEIDQVEKRTTKRYPDVARGIRGDPIAPSEVGRGAKVTQKALQEEIRRWRDNPILSKYAPSKSEEEKIVGNLKRG